MRSHVLLLALATAACAGGKSRPDTAPAAGNWRQVIMTDDLKRLYGWRDDFVKALEMARAAGHAAEIDREGALLQPDTAIEPVALPIGQYRCRVIKLGANGPAMSNYTPYPQTDCEVHAEGAVMGFTYRNGPQRPVGLLFDDTRARKIFLGSLMMGDERRSFDYGADASRDVVGAVQRIGSERWRMILPSPRFESVMDVMELVPAR